MVASLSDISEWFDSGKKSGHHYMIIVCDTFDWEDYPVYTGEVDFWTKYGKFVSGAEMQKVMEVYNLKLDKMEQLNQDRVFNLP